jgi:hypothetical protein
MSSSRRSPFDTGALTRQFTLKLDEFGAEALEQESARLGVSEEELVRFALLYYLADVDSGRIARSVPAPSPPAADEQQRS